MSGMQRRKGQSGERELAGIIRDLTGWDVRRRVRQHDGDSDLEGVPGWAVEVKRHAKATPAVIDGWWDQAVRQATGSRPVLVYRLDRRDWVARWPLHVVMDGAGPWVSAEWTCESSVEAWCAVARETQG